MPTNADMMRMMTELRESHHIDNPVKRGSPIDITWESFSMSVKMAAGADGRSLTFQRTKYADHDAALGQAISSGRHEWTVRAPNGNANNYCGVAVENCDKRIYPAGTSAWAMYLHDGDLCSGVAARPKKSLGFTRPDGTRGYMEAPGASTRGNGAKNPLWAKRVLQPIARGTPITVILDMEERTLSFAIGDEEPKLGFTNLPAGECARYGSVAASRSAASGAAVW